MVACVVAAGAEGVLAGSGVTARFDELVQPAFSPPLWAWAINGALYYVLFFFLLKSLLGTVPTSTLSILGVVLAATLLGANAAWNRLFFREKDLWLSTIFYVPYAAVALTLAFVLFRLRSPLLRWFLVYVGNLAYAGWWGIGLWCLNR